MSEVEVNALRNNAGGGGGGNSARRSVSTAMALQQ